MLTFPLKKEWYEKIKSGEKTIEYREVKPYWTSRLVSFYKENTEKDDDFNGYIVDWENGLLDAEFYFTPSEMFVEDFASKGVSFFNAWCQLRLGYSKTFLNARVTKIEIVNGKDTDLHIDRPVFAIHLADVREEKRMTDEEKLSIEEEQILFHTLGYDYQPRWNDAKGGYRNWFVTPENDNNCDYQTIKSLIAKGYMEKGGERQWGGGCFFSVTDKGFAYVVDLWGKKKEQNKPSRSKRRYQAYFDWLDCFSGSFKDFLNWLKITDDDRIFCPEEVEYVEEFKKRWGI